MAVTDASEETPLLSNGNGNSNGTAGNGHGDGINGNGKAAAKPRSLFSARSRMLLAAFLISTSFCFTQVSILFLFAQMVCQDFYNHHPPYEGTGDRCKRPEVDAGTAQQFAILGMSTTFAGTFNLFLAGWMIKRWGPKAALFVQTFMPALRVAIQTVGAIVGGRNGIIIFQISQLMTVIGGPAGYLLVLNTAISEVVTAAERTGTFGMLQGAQMIGTATGFLVGSLLADIFDILLPFKVAVCGFSLSCAYIVFIVPYQSPESITGGTSRATGVSSFFAPLKIVGWHKMRTKDGKPFKFSGITFLALGVFLGVLATGYAPMLIQIYSMNHFNFTPAENGYLMAVNFITRGLFLMFVFPVIISTGRKWFARSEAGRTKATESQGEGIPTQPEDFDPIVGVIPEGEPAEPPKPVDEESGSGFDLFFLRWSLVVDGVITALAGLADAGWQIYVVGGLLPLASGSASAAKGVITEMCPPGKRPDALQAMTLVENIAVLSTLALFGYVFAYFSELGKAHLTFFCNAAMAIVAVSVLALSHFPPAGATHEVEQEASTTETAATDDERDREN